MGLRNLNQWSSILKEATNKILPLVKYLSALHVTSTYACGVALVYGPSMLPTFSLTGDLVLAEKISTRFGKVVPGDIVLIRSPENPRKIVTKRVMGMEGDTVTYVVDPQNSDRVDTIIVPKGHVWIEGDHIYNSRDSRNFGSVPCGLLHARVFWRTWPLEKFGSVGKSK